MEQWIKPQKSWQDWKWKRRKTKLRKHRNGQRNFWKKSQKKKLTIYITVQHSLTLELMGRVQWMKLPKDWQMRFFMRRINREIQLFNKIYSRLRWVDFLRRSAHKFLKGPIISRIIFKSTLLSCFHHRHTFFD